MHSRKHTRTLTHTHARKKTYSYISLSLYLSISIFLFIFHFHSHTHTNTLTHTHTHSLTHTHTHTHTHTNVQKDIFMMSITRAFVNRASHKNTGLFSSNVFLLIEGKRLRRSELEKLRPPAHVMSVASVAHSLASLSSGLRVQFQVAHVLFQ